MIYTQACYAESHLSVSQIVGLSNVFPGPLWKTHPRMLMKWNISHLQTLDKGDTRGKAGTAFQRHPAAKSLIFPTFRRLSSQSREPPGERLELLPTGIANWSQKHCDPTFQLLLLLLFLAGLKLLSLDSRPTDRAYLSRSNSQQTCNAVTQVR